MVNYQNASIYKLCCNDVGVKEIYVGSTCNFDRRKQEHKKCCKYPSNTKKYNLPVYKYIRSNGGFENWSMILIESVSCDTKKELHAIERKYVEGLNASLNCAVPTRTTAEYRAENKDKIKQRNNEKFTCECGSPYTYKNKRKHQMSFKHQEYVSWSSISKRITDFIGECRNTTVTSIQVQVTHQSDFYGFSLW